MTGGCPAEGSSESEQAARANAKPTQSSDQRLCLICNLMRYSSECLLRLAHIRTSPHVFPAHRIREVTVPAFGQGRLPVRPDRSQTSVHRLILRRFGRWLAMSTDFALQAAAGPISVGTDRCGHAVSS